MRRAQARQARFLRQVYEADPLLCPHCGGTMKVIAVIERPAVVRQLLDDLGLPTAAPIFRAPPDPPDAPAAGSLREWSSDPLGCACGEAALHDLPIPDPACLLAGRCSHSRGRGASLLRLAGPCLRTGKVPLDPPLRRW